MSRTRQTPNRTASADFIDNQLPSLDPAFNHPGIPFDPAVGNFVVPPRPTIAEVEEMEFWAQLFPECMVKLQKNHPEPEGRHKAGCSIRCERSWSGVRSQLEKAKNKYDVPKRKTARSVFRKGYRKVADHTEPLQMISAVAANVPYISPFVGSVNMLLDIAAMAAKVRQQATTAFEPGALDDSFENIEVFIAMFPNDSKLRQTAVDLVAAIFNAIEHAIGFFLSYEISRVFRAVTQGTDYGHKLTSSIEDIQSHGNKLKDQAEKMAMHSTNATLEGLMRRSDAILAAALSNAARTEKKDKDQQLVDERTTRMLCHLHDLLKAGEDRWKETMTRFEELEKKRSDEVNYLLGQIVNERQQRNTPSPQPPAPTSPWIFPASQEPQTYQPIFTLPQQPSVTWLQVPVLTATQTPTPSLHEPYSRPFVISQLDAFMVEANDVKYILDRRAIILPVSMRRAEAALQSLEFQEWLTHQSSQELLIQGDSYSDGCELSGVSLISALVYSAVSDKWRYICLAWFCSLHDEPEERNRTRAVGGHGIVQSFLAQILRQSTFDQYTIQQCEAFLRDNGNHNLGQLCSLLEWLLRKLQKEVQVIIIIDEIGYYETDGYERSMLRVLRLLLRLTRDTDIACVIKILATSAQMTDEVHDAFRDGDDFVIDFDSLEEGDEMEELEVDRELLHSSDN